jgi:hypothetical protein
VHLLRAQLPESSLSDFWAVSIWFYVIFISYKYNAIELF